MMNWLATDAVDIAKTNGSRLDYTPQSIQEVDRVLGKMHADCAAGKLDRGLDGLAMAFGAYLGEVICKTDPDAKWEQDDPVAGPKSYPLHWRDGEAFPCAWAYRRIVNGDEDNLWFKYQVFREDRLRNVRPATKR